MHFIISLFLLYICNMLHFLNWGTLSSSQFLVVIWVAFMVIQKWLLVLNVAYNHHLNVTLKSWRFVTKWSDQIRWDSARNRRGCDEKDGIVSACGVKAWMQEGVEALMVTMTMWDVDGGQRRWGQANSSPLTPVTCVWVCSCLSMSLKLVISLLHTLHTHTFIKRFV